MFPLWIFYLEQLQTAFLVQAQQLIQVFINQVHPKLEDVINNMLVKFAENSSVLLDILIHIEEFTQVSYKFLAAWIPIDIMTRKLNYVLGEKPYTCPICGKKFAQRPGYTYHIRTHTGKIIRQTFNDLIFYDWKRVCV